MSTQVQIDPSMKAKLRIAEDIVTYKRKRYRIEIRLHRGDACGGQVIKERSSHDSLDHGCFSIRNYLLYFFPSS